MDYSTYVPNYEEVMNVLLRLFNLPLATPLSNPPLFQLKQSVLNCFVNVPLEYYRVLVVLGDRESTLRNLFEMLEFEIKRTPADGYLLLITSLSDFAGISVLPPASS